MDNLSDVIKEKARPLIARYKREFVNLYDILDVQTEANIDAIFTAYKSKRKSQKARASEAFYVLSSSFFRLVYDTAFKDRLKFRKQSTHNQRIEQEIKKSSTQSRRKKQTFLMMFAIGFILCIPILFIGMPIGLIAFSFSTLLSLLVSLYYGYVEIPYFDEKDKSGSRNVRRTLWVEPSLGMAKFEIIYTKGSSEVRLLADSFVLDGQQDFSEENMTFSNNLLIPSYWTNGFFGWHLTRQKLLLPVEDTIRISQRL